MLPLPAGLDLLAAVVVPAQDATTQSGAVGFPLWVLYLATGINALSGGAYAARRGFDIVGVLGMGVIQGIGGLLLMSILLQLGEPFVLSDPWFIFSASVAGLLAFFFAAAISQALRFALVLDALAMGLFVSIGAEQSLRVDVNPMSAVFIAVVTATGGLVMRDILAGNAPMILRPGVLVGVVALAGAVLFVVLVQVFAVAVAQAEVVTVLFVAVMRTLAVLRDWRTHEAQDLSDRMNRYWEGRR